MIPNTSPSVSSTILLRDILTLLAQNASPEFIITTLLESALPLVGSQAGFYIIFENPRKVSSVNLDTALLPNDSHLLDAVARLSDDMFLSSDLPAPLHDQYKGWLLVPLRAKDKVISALFLLYTEDATLDEATSDMLVSIVHALSIVTRETRVAARHEKLTRNQNEFVRIVSHDLRSPLTSIQGFASMLESKMMGELNEKQLYYIGKILSGVTQMTSLVENIQDAGRYDPETGFYEMERAPIDLTEIAKRVVKNHLLPAEKSELTLMVNVADDVPIISADSNMLERSLINLVDNAIKYTPNGGKIEVGVQREGDVIVMSVKDNGLGISKENLRQIFQRHFRIRRPEHKLVKGSGLGLFIVRSVALRHGGDAFVESVEGEGTTFGIIIPLDGENLLTGQSSE
jgi:signal transduction histidine kinase